MSKVWEGPDERYKVRERATLVVPRQLSLVWVGPFRVTKVLGDKAYRLQMLEGGVVPRTWNAVNFKFYFT